MHAQLFSEARIPIVSDTERLRTTPWFIAPIFNLSGNKWDIIYSGATREHLCDRLNPGCSYRLHVYCIGEGGQSAVILSNAFYVNVNLDKTFIL